MAQAPTKLRWTDEELKEIARQYWADGVACCPVDDSKLAIVQNHSQAKRSILAAHCLRCGRNAENIE